jgi:phage terminase large subunit-like protein
MDGFTAEGTYKHVTADGFAWHEWSLSEGDDINDLELLKSVNPASWIDETELRARRDSPSTQPWQLARFTAGLWWQGAESVISSKEWNACAEEGISIPDGSQQVVIGVDIGYTRDCFAAVSAWLNPEGLIVLDEASILEPPGDGTSIDIEDMLATCHAAAERWPGCTFAFDPNYGGQQLLQRLERELPTCEHLAYSQDPRMMASASMAFAELVSTRKLRHPGQAQMTEHVLAGAARFIGERWKFVKAKDRKRWIDALIAGCMACDVATRIEPKRESVYATRGLITA